MVELQSDKPKFYWTFDRIDDLTEEQENLGFDGCVWKMNHVDSCAIGSNFVAFNLTVELGGVPRHVRFEETSDNVYTHLADGLVWVGVKAETATHVILTGRWAEDYWGNGIFIAVLPIGSCKQNRGSKKKVSRPKT